MQLYICRRSVETKIFFVLSRLVYNNPRSASKNLSILTQKLVSKLSEIWSGLFIPILIFNPPRIPGPGVKKAPDPQHCLPESAKSLVCGVELAACHEKDRTLRDEKEQEHEGQVGACARQVQVAPVQERAQDLREKMGKFKFIFRFFYVKGIWARIFKSLRSP